MKAKIGLHALKKILQDLAKEVQKAFIVFEALQVDVRLLHYKVLWTLRCITYVIFFQPSYVKTLFQ